MKNPIKFAKPLPWPAVFVTLALLFDDGWPAAAVTLALAFRHEMSAALRCHTIEVELPGFKARLDRAYEDPFPGRRRPRRTAAMRRSPHSCRAMPRKRYAAGR